MTRDLLRRSSDVVFILAIILVAYCNYLIFLVVPNEKIMGPVQRIFYFHVGAAIASYVAIGVVLLGSVMYLANRNWRYDALAQSAGEVTFVFCTIVLVSGMIWGHVAWNRWFSWEPRLVSFLILWLIFFTYNVLRTMIPVQQVASFCSVLGILGAVNVPIVIYSIKLLPKLAQNHPEVVANDGLKDPLFKSTMFWGMGAMTLLCIALILFRLRIAYLERRSPINVSNYRSS
jgi:heme exporter protein C